MALAAAALGAVSPASATTCSAESRIRADPRWRDRDCELCVVNRIEVGPGSGLRWNGAALNLATLLSYLEILGRMTPEPMTLLIIHRGADCGQIAAVHDAVERAQPCPPGYHCSFALSEARRPRPPRRRSH